MKKNVFPNLENKHLEKALFNPEDFVKYSGIKKAFKSFLPKKYIIIYDAKLFQRMNRKYKFKSIGKILGKQIYYFNKIGVIYMRGIGSPHAVTTFEEAISLGGRIFINIGFAGGLQEPGFFLCEKALRDEGTSYHYIPHGRFSYPDKKLTNKLGKVMGKLGLSYERGSTWTIDAPYRETKKEIESYRKEGIATVEMEASALFAVAKVRKVKIASAFIVSDILGKKWEPNFHKIDVQKGLNKLFEAAVGCLKNIK